MVARIADAAYAERAPYGQRQARRRENRRGQAFGEGQRCDIGPECTRLRIHTLRAYLDIVEISGIDDDAVFSLGLTILRVPSALHHDLERALIRVLHDFDDVPKGSRPEHRCGDPMKEVAEVNCDCVPGCFIEK